MICVDESVYFSYFPTIEYCTQTHLERQFFFSTGEETTNLRFKISPVAIVQLQITLLTALSATIGILLRL